MQKNNRSTSLDVDATAHRFDKGMRRDTLDCSVPICVVHFLFLFHSLSSLLIFGDSSIVPGLQTATTDSSTRYTEYKYNSSIFLPIRTDMWDSALVEAGPPPIPLSNGNILFFYNSARTGVPSKVTRNT